MYYDQYPHAPFNSSCSYYDPSHLVTGPTDCNATNVKAAFTSICLMSADRETSSCQFFSLPYYSRTIYKHRTEQSRRVLSDDWSGVVWISSPLSTREILIPMLDYYKLEIINLLGVAVVVGLILKFDWESFGAIFYRPSQGKDICDG